MKRFALLLALPLVACGLSMKVPEVDLEEGKAASDASSTTNGDAGAGLPCDISSFLDAHCTSCHGAKPTGPMSLMTYDDLVAPARTQPAKKVYALALERMQDAKNPMPPGAALDADAFAAFAAWADAGAPMTACTTSADASVPPRADAGLPECVLNSDCPGTLICRSGTCDLECIKDKDCTVTWTCVETRCHPPEPTSTPETDASADASDASDADAGE